MTQDRNGWITFRCLEVTQPIGLFYVGVMRSVDILQIAYSDVRRIAGERREIETYLGIERPLGAKRVSELKKYVTLVDATFPSPIIVALESKNTDYDSKTQMFSVKGDKDVAKILDGQHRIAGLEGYSGEAFDLVVTLFVDMDIEDQAMVFATINLEQTKVNKSLAYDLYDYAKARSPQKTAHNIVRVLDSTKGSPFAGKIKILGTAGDPNEVLSQATFVEALLKLISSDPMKDRDLLKRGRTPSDAPPQEEQRLVFRNMFLRKQDDEIGIVVWNFFAAVEKKWGVFWSEVKRGFLLNRTTGFKGLMGFFPYAYRATGGPGSVPAQERFDELFSKINLPGERFTRDNFPPGTGGQTLLRDMLLSQTSLG